ncbi:hypothetical protein [Candidatus Trichorickettsia mobilis]|uniref:hypothetical protein n=1 Tax=Candidatus Trichorickettsia mobilis TaxID=1346319 RepID=UPI002B25FB45|nr:hypothetical protein [Candidatus Trichorickettsia mobilis]
MFFYRAVLVYLIGFTGCFVIYGGYMNFIRHILKILQIAEPFFLALALLIFFLLFHYFMVVNGEDVLLYLKSLLSFTYK